MAWFPVSAAPAIFAALSSALLFVLGAITGACRLLGRGRGFAGASSFGGASPFAFPFALRTDPDGFADAAVDGRGPGRVPTSEVVRDSAGRVTPLVAIDAADGGRARLGRAEGTPLKDCREEEREGTDWLDGWRTSTARTSWMVSVTF